MEPLIACVRFMLVAGAAGRVGGMIWLYVAWWFVGWAGDGASGRCCGDAGKVKCVDGGAIVYVLFDAWKIM